MKIIYIYGLVDSVTKQIRYIGKTLHLRQRLREHLNKYSLKKETYKNHWIKQVLSKNANLEIIVLEECNENNWAARESYWIEHYNSLGNKLTNGTSGGDGQYFIYKFVKEKVSKALKGRHLSFKTEFKKGHVHSNEVITKIKLANKGKHYSPSTEITKDSIEFLELGKPFRFKKGMTPWCKGKKIGPISKEQKQKQSISAKKTWKIFKENGINPNEVHRGIKRFNATSPYIGVSWDKFKKKWRVTITLNSKLVFQKRFDTELEAALAYNKKAIELFGINAKVNNI